MYINKAFVYGNLTRDPEVKSLPSGSMVANFSLATNRVWKDKEGRKQESVEYHNIVTFGRQAELVGQYLKQGSSVFIEGRLQTRSWDGQDGNKKYRTEIVTDTMQFGPKSGGSGGVIGDPQPHGDRPQKESGQSEDTQGNKPDTIEYPEEDINPEDIPF